jgi:hypothetical protein
MKKLRKKTFKNKYGHQIINKSGENSVTEMESSNEFNYNNKSN